MRQATCTGVLLLLLLLLLMRCCSFGVVMWELLTLRPPWEGMDPFQLPVSRRRGQQGHAVAADVLCCWW